MLQKNKNNSLSIRKIFLVLAKYTLKELLIHSGQKPHLEVNIVYAQSVVEIFPPCTLYTWTRGRPFWGGYVCSRGCLSNLRMLMEDAIFNTKYHLLSLQEFIWKDICQALHCLRNFRDHFGKETIFLYDGKMFQRRNVFLTRWEDVSKKKCITLQVL